MSKESCVSTPHYFLFWFSLVNEKVFPTKMETETRCPNKQYPFKKLFLQNVETKCKNIVWPLKLHKKKIEYLVCNFPGIDTVACPNAF